MVKKDTHIKSGYRLTEVGIIPVDWEMDSLKNNLKSAPRYWIWAAAVDYSFQLPKYLRITDISEDWYYMPEKMVSVNHPFAKNYYLANWDIVVARTWASVWKSYLYDNKDGELVFAGFLICLKTDETRLIPQFLKNYLQTPQYWNWVKVTSMRSGQPWINGNEYASLNIPLPSKPEQSAIAQTLSDTDALISSLDKLIKKKKSIKQGTMQELLTGKRRLLGFIKPWTEKILDELGTFWKWNWIKKDQADSWDLPSIRYGEIYTKHHNFIKEFYSYISRDVANSATRINSGDILFAWSGETKEEIWKCVSYIWEVEAYAWGDIIIFSPKWMDSLFLWYLLNISYVIKQKANYGQWDAVVHIGAGNLKKIKIKIPEHTEQSAIANIIRNMDLEISELEKKRDKYKQIKQGMMSELLTGNIRLLWVK